MVFNEVAEKLYEGYETSFAVSRAIGEYSTNDLDQILDVMASNIATTLVEDFLSKETVRKDFFPDLDLSEDELKILVIALYQKVVDQLKEL